MKEIRTLSKTTVFALSVFYLLLIFLASIFFWFLVQEIATGEGRMLNSAVLDVGFTFVSSLSITLFIALLLYAISKSIRIRKVDPFRGGLKLKFIVFFSGFSLLISIPQIVLAVLLISSTSNLWISPSTERILQDSRASLIASQNEKNKILENLTKSSLYDNAVEEMINNPMQQRQIWRNFQYLNSHLSSIQAFNEGGEDIVFAGNEICRLDYSPRLEQMNQGEFPLSIYKEHSVFRYVNTVKIEDRSYKVVSSIIRNDVDSVLINDISNLYEHYLPLIESREWIQRNLILILLLFVLAINIFSVYLSLYFSDLIIYPILDVEKAIKRVSQGEFSVRLYPAKNSSFTDLSESFNKMVYDLEKLQKNSSHFNKMKAWQEIAKRMAHEINNPLTPIRLSAERIMRQYKKGSKNFGEILEKSGNAIISEVENLQGLLHDFRAFSKLPEPKMESVNLLHLLETEAILYEHLNEKKVVFSLENVDPTINLRVDKGQIKQVFANLFKNAMEAIEGDGEIQLVTALVSRQNIKYCRIVVEDNGKGMTKEVVENVFTPYYTTKNDGTGLGLAIVERIIFTHKGRIKVYSKLGKGTTFIVDLPLEMKYE